MTITETVEPARDELGIEVCESSDSNQQDTNTTEKSFFASYADWLLGAVGGEDSNDDEEETVEQQQPPISSNEEETEQQPSSSPNENEEVSSSQSQSRVVASSTPPRPQIIHGTWQDEMTLMHRCPMILKPFAVLAEVLFCLVATVVLTLRFFASTFIIFFLGGPILMHQATDVARESNKKVENCINQGLRAEGNIERVWSTWEMTSGTGDSPPDLILVEHARIWYEYGGDRYQMTLSPLRKNAKDSFGPRDTIPIVLLTQSPRSGIPEAYLAGLSWSPLCRTLTFSLGIAVSAYWTLFAAFCFPVMYGENASWQYDWRVLMGTVLIIGVLPIALFLFWKDFRNCVFSLSLLKQMQGPTATDAVEVRMASGGS